MAKVSITIFRQAFLLLLISSVSQAQDIKKIISNYFKEIQSGKYPSIPMQFSLSENANATLQLLQPYLKDSLHAVRAKAYEATHLAASNSSVASMRNQGVDVLISACRDKDFGNVGLALGYLTEYRKEDFNASAKDSIRSLVRIQTPHFDRLIKLAGFLNLIDLKKEIQPYSQPGNSTQIRWAAILSLARMGESSAIQEMMKRITKLPMNDDVVYEVCPDLIYTRQPEAIEYLVEVLKSDAKDCMSADAERETAILCGYRIMEQLAPIIAGYPLNLDESGDILTNDYPKALSTVRQWFQSHKTFKILNDRF
jgi:hypothetical protein